jgi:PAS domain S-box-containing protein
MPIVIFFQKCFFQIKGIALILVLLLNSCNSVTSGKSVNIHFQLSVFHFIGIILAIISILILHYFFKIKQNKLIRRKKLSYSDELYLLRTLIDNMPDFIYVKDLQSRFVVANQYLANMLKAGSTDNLIGKTDFDFFPKKMAQKYFNDEQLIIKDKIPLINIEEEALDKHKHKIIISTTKVPWLDREGNTLGIIGIGRNISDIKKIELKLLTQTEKLKGANTLLVEKHEKIQQQAEELVTQARNLKDLNEELQKINETKDKFISIIAHDLKNPFNAIINFSELLIIKDDGSIKPKQMEMIKIINSSSKLAFSLLENLLYWAKNQNASIPFNPSQINISDMIKEVVDFMEVSAKLKEIKLENESAPDVHVYADHNMITTILRNIISNAIKFTSKKGEITITTSVDNSLAYVTITDNGIGISNEQMNNLFSIDKETSRGTAGESGTGFGLVLCHEFAQHNRGAITVKSIQGKGSSFILSLPLNAD